MLPSNGLQSNKRIIEKVFKPYQITWTRF